MAHKKQQVLIFNYSEYSSEKKVVLPVRHNQTFTFSSSVYYPDPFEVEAQQLVFTQDETAKPRKLEQCRVMDGTPKAEETDLSAKSSVDHNASKSLPPSYPPKLQGTLEDTVGPNVYFSFANDDSEKDVQMKTMVENTWKRHWEQAIAATKLDDHKAIDQWFERLWKCHSEPQRHYHTVVHIWEILKWIEALEESLDVQSPLQFAAFFHDAIYDPTSAKNEIQSANLWNEFCHDVGLLNEELHQIARTLILATERHAIIPSDDDTSNLIAADPYLQALFLDIDMAILGKPTTDAYLAYAALIRKEYQHVPQVIYCEKRAEILQGFLNKSHLYLSPIFKELLEGYARRNLSAEIHLLMKGIIPGEN